MNRTPPRGYRNHNPGNVDRGADRWLGMAEDQSADARFIVFTAPEYGIRCIMRVLITYHERYGLNTLRGIVNRWAPPVGRNPATGQEYAQNTTGYVNHVATLTGWHADEPLDLFDRDTNLTVTRAIIRHELGDPRPFGKPPHWYDQTVYDRALALAGFEPEKKPLIASRTIAGTSVAGLAAVAQAVYESAADTIQTATDAVAPLTLFSPDTVKLVLTALIFAGLGAVAYARWSDQRRRVT